MMKKDTVIKISNDGDMVSRTNYFDTPQAERGEFYLAWNAGCGRLLVPDVMKDYLSDIKCKKAEISQKEDRIIIIFDDETEMPFNLQLAFEQNDRAITPGECVFSVYVREGEKYRFPCTCYVDKAKITCGVDGYGRQHFVCRICWKELGIGGNWWDYTCDCWNR